MSSTLEQDFERVVERVRNATSDQLNSITCPGCNGSLKIQVSDREKAALSVMCRQCKCRVVVDGLVQLPDWVETLGRRVETAGK